MENLAEYLNKGVEDIVRQSLKASLKNPRESAFILGFMSAQKKAAKKRLRAEEQGVHVPPFLIASISSQCNLFCAGCYARANNSIGDTACRGQLNGGEWARIFAEAEEMGIAFILLAGGESLMRRDVLSAAAGFHEIVFPVFTNGTMLDSNYINLFQENRNLVPILSLEGDEAMTDARRGAGVYTKLRSAMTDLNAGGILFGASITVTKENLESVTGLTFIGSLEAAGCKVVLFVEYVPVSGADGQTAPGAEDRASFAARLDVLRERHGHMLFVAFPGDEEVFGGCLAAGRGFFHISPTGDAEPCPFSPFSDTSLKTSSLKDALKSPLFRKLDLGGYLAGEHLGGCVLFNKEDEVKELLKI